MFCPDCNDNRCEVSEGPGDRCRQEATRIVREPYTPAAFRVHCCEEHAQDLIDFGYTADVTTFPESPQLKSLKEVQSERENEVLRRSV